MQAWLDDPLEGARTLYCLHVAGFTLRNMSYSDTAAAVLARCAGLDLVLNETLGRRLASSALADALGRDVSLVAQYKPGNWVSDQYWRGPVIAMLHATR